MSPEIIENDEVGYQAYFNLREAATILSSGLVAYGHKEINPQTLGTMTKRGILRPHFSQPGYLPLLTPCDVFRAYMSLMIKKESGFSSWTEVRSCLGANGGLTLQQKYKNTYPWRIMCGAMAIIGVDVSRFPSIYPFGEVIDNNLKILPSSW